MFMITILCLPFFEKDGANYMFYPPSPTPISCHKLDRVYISEAIVSSTRARDFLKNHSFINSSFENRVQADLSKVSDALVVVSTCLFS